MFKEGVGGSRSERRESQSESARERERERGMMTRFIFQFC